MHLKYTSNVLFGLSIHLLSMCHFFFSSLLSTLCAVCVHFPYCMMVEPSFFSLFWFIRLKWHNSMPTPLRQCAHTHTKQSWEKSLHTNLVEKTRHIEWWQICICSVRHRARCTADCIGKQLDVYLYAKWLTTVCHVDTFFFNFASFAFFSWVEHFLPCRYCRCCCCWPLSVTTGSKKVIFFVSLLLLREWL